MRLDLAFRASDPDKSCHVDFWRLTLDSNAIESAFSAELREESHAVATFKPEKQESYA
jgi:hypothetical protein